MYYSLSAMFERKRCPWLGLGNICILFAMGMMRRRYRVKFCIWWYGVIVICFGFKGCIITLTWFDFLTFSEPDCYNCELLVALNVLNTILKYFSFVKNSIHTRVYKNRLYHTVVLFYSLLIELPVHALYCKMLNDRIGIEMALPLMWGNQVTRLSLREEIRKFTLTRVPSSALFLWMRFSCKLDQWLVARDCKMPRFQGLRTLGNPRQRQYEFFTNTACPMRGTRL